MGNKKIEITFYWNDDESKTLHTRDAMIGVWDGKENDDEIFFWFDKDGSELIGDHNDDFTVVSVKMDVAEVKVGDHVYTRSYTDLNNSFKANQDRILLFENMDKNIRNALKRRREFVVKSIDNDGDVGFEGYISTFPKECVQWVLGGAA